MGISNKRNKLRLIAILLLFIVALNALAAGYSFMNDPSGKEIGITTDYLKEVAPFRNFFIPGVLLFVFIGILGCIIAVLIIRNQNNYPLLIIMQGCIIVIWIFVQLVMVKSFHPLHLIIAAIGITLFSIGWALRYDHRSTHRI